MCIRDREITQQPNGDKTIGSFSLTFYPDNYPKVTDKLIGKGKYIPQPRKLGSKTNDAIYITLVADGFEDNELKITCKDFPK